VNTPERQQLVRALAPALEGREHLQRLRISNGDSMPLSGLPDVVEDRFVRPYRHLVSEQRGETVVLVVACVAVGADSQQTDVEPDDGSAVRVPH
jgi:hypothetical protein